MALKIVLLIPKLNISGGIERIITEYANWIQRNTDSIVTIVKLNSGKNAFEFDKKIRIIEYKGTEKGKLKNISGRLSFCKKTFKKLKPDIIYCTYAKPIMIAKLTKPKYCRIIGSEHSVPKYRGKNEAKLRYFSSTLCDGFIFQTEDVKKDYPKKTQKKSIVIPNAAYVTQIPNNTKKENLLIGMGRLEKVKAFDELIKACSVILEKKPSYKLKIIGEGTEKSNLESLIKTLHLERQVALVGNLKHPETEIAKAKIFISTSHYEGFSNSLVEAMTIGTCCVSYDCDYGPRNIINHEKNGILVPAGNSKLLETAIEEILANDKKRASFEKSAKESSKIFAPKNIHNNYFSYFKKIGGE